MMRSALRFKTFAPALAIAIVWAAAIWWPARSDLDTSMATIDDLTADRLALVQELRRLDDAALEEESYLDDLDRFAVAIPPQIGLGPFAQDLHAAAAANGVRIDLLAPTNVVDASTALRGNEIPPGVSSVTLAITGIGSYRQAIDFVEAVTDHTRLVIVDAMTLTAADEDPDEIVIDVELRIFTTDELIEADPALLADIADEEET